MPIPNKILNAPARWCGLGVLIFCGSTAADDPAAGQWEAFEDGPGGRTAMVLALAEFQDPGDATPSLYAGGRFSNAGGAQAPNVARWHEESWHAVGDGTNGAVEALTIFDEDGDGPTHPALYAAGDFTIAGGVKARNVARWDGTQWSAVGEGIDGYVTDLAVYDEDGDGPIAPALFAVGIFGEMGNIARWNGNAWSRVGEGLEHVAYSLALGDPDGNGPRKPDLLVGGVRTVHVWNGVQWQTFGEPGFRTFAMATFDDDGNGRPALFAAGEIIHPDAGASNTIAKWDGNAWVPLPELLDERVYALAIFDQDGAGPAKPTLVVSGSFTKVGDRTAHGLAAWDGTGWSVLENGPRSDPLTPRMNCLAVFDRDGDGPRPTTLVVGGIFTLNGAKEARNVAAWSAAAPAAPAE